ncbi:uncharacterized protein C5orf34 homolog isoform X2 [Mixophyes fleayi]|uniref:uncharacterized protein C5orf34 homolog isoform X2 n=1 Tax=Mixophyes fleayi TaxID=3061075 RepID=UPI003F4E04E1
MSSSCDLVLYSDDSVEAQYPDGGRLCLSPCGTEFMYERPWAGGHPVQGPERGRHRTEFVTSSCRDQVLQALNFRNTFSSRPFLPSRLIPSEKKICILAEIADVTWPTLADDSGCVVRLQDGSVKVSSLDGHAHLYMTTIQKEFTVEFLCQLSCTTPAPDTASHSEGDLMNSSPKAAGNKTTRDINKSKYASCVFQEDSQPCVTKHALQYTWLMQRFSVSCCPESFQYPMGLALNFHRQSAQQDELKGSADSCDTTADCDIGNVCVVPRALPLSCPATHMHRFNFWNVSLEKDDVCTVHPLPLKVVLCNDILYRFILEGTNLVEIHPGDGSVFLSEGDCMGKYFKHCFVTGETKQAEDRLYTVRDLPPDKPRALYSVRSIISQARRFLESCCRNKLSLNPLSHTCCWKMLKDSSAFHKASNASKHEPFGWCCLRLPDGSSELVELECPGQYVSYTRTAAAWCQQLDEKSQREILTPVTTKHCSVAAELQKIHRFNFLLENSTLNHKSNSKLSSQLDTADSLQERMGEINIQSILEKTSKAIQDIDLLLSSRKK